MLIFESAGLEGNLAALRDAIENQFTVSFYYAGKKFRDPNQTKYTKANWRRVEPFALGKTKKGDWVLRAYQYNGTTNTKNNVYKTFRVDEITSDVKLVYDRGGQVIRSYEPKTYVDSKGNIAAFRSNGSDKGMGGGVDKYFDVDAEFLAGEPKQTFTKPDSEPQPIPITKQPTQPAPKNNMPVKPTPPPAQPIVKPAIKPIKKPKLEPEVPQIREPEQEPEETSDEWEPVMENRGFMKWLNKVTI